MIKIMFVCYGNICRSPMAEFMMKDLVKKMGEEKEFLIESAATSYEEIGSPVHWGTANILKEMGIDYSAKRARKLLKEDYNNYDYFIGMDSNNKRDMLRIFGGDEANKVSLLLDYTDIKRDVLDPYWTRDFSATKLDVTNGVKGFYKFLTAKK